MQGSSILLVVTRSDTEAKTGFKMILEAPHQRKSTILKPTAVDAIWQNALFLNMIYGRNAFSKGRTFSYHMSLVHSIRGRGG